MEKETLKIFSLYERMIIKIHKKIFTKHQNITRISIINSWLK